MSKLEIALKLGTILIISWTNGFFIGAFNEMLKGDRTELITFHSIMIGTALIVYVMFRIILGSWG